MGFPTVTQRVKEAEQRGSFGFRRSIWENLKSPHRRLPAALLWGIQPQAHRGYQSNGSFGYY